MLDYLDTDRCRMEFLRQQLDDPEATPCGRCDNCGGLEVAVSVSEQEVEQAHERLVRPGVVVQPRKMWPSALANLGLDLKGRIGDQAEEGRAVARLTDLGHGQALRELFREGAEDTTVPASLARAVVDVLNDWRPQVDAIVHVELGAPPHADQRPRRGGVPLPEEAGRRAAGRSSTTPWSPGQGSMNSAQRVAAVTRRFALESEPLDGASVLLVDDLVDTGWTLTLAAQALRAAGAGRVLPLALAVSA